MGQEDGRPPWRRKTAEERGRDELVRDLGPRAALLMGGIAALVGAALAAFAALGNVDDAGELFLLALLGASAFGVPATALAYAMQAAGWLSPPKRIRMGVCTACFQLTLDGTLDHCECGGAFEDVDGWTPQPLPALRL